MEKIKIYGERNTGTNWLQKLFENNFHVDIIPGQAHSIIKKRCLGYPLYNFAKNIYFKVSYNKNLGWKHSLIPYSKKLLTFDGIKKILIITITKNPYSWLLSLYKRPYTKKNPATNFDSFIVNNWKTEGRENSPKHYKNPIILWNKKNESYIEMNKIKTLYSVNLRYEDILKNPEIILDNLSKRYNLVRKTKDFQIITGSVKKEKQKDYFYYKDYYLNERWKNEITKHQYEVINTYLDQKIMSYFGYKYLKYIT